MRLTTATCTVAIVLAYLSIVLSIPVDEVINQDDDKRSNGLKRQDPTTTIVPVTTSATASTNVPTASPTAIPSTSTAATPTVAGSTGTPSVGPTGSTTTAGTTSTSGGLVTRPTTSATSVPTGEPPEPPVVEGDGDVEDSKNNTKNMPATTFHVALRFKEEKWSSALEDPKTTQHQSFKKMLQSAIEKTYTNDGTFKQFVLIKLSDSEKNEGPSDKRNDVGKPGVISDFYLRFYTSENHLAKLSDEIRDGKLITHPVSTKFVRAYPAEPHGRVCTPDCKIQCYSYCDKGCCQVHIVQNLESPAAPDGSLGCQGTGCQQQLLPLQPVMSVPCQGSTCGQPSPCQGASCQPAIQPVIPMSMPVQMPCQGLACGQTQQPQMQPCLGGSCVIQQQAPAPCHGATCFPQQPAPYPNYAPVQPRMQATYCQPSCQQNCSPICPAQCCMGPQVAQMPMPFMFPQPFQQFQAPMPCGPRGCK